MSTPARLFYTIGIIPTDGRPVVTTSRTIRYESLEQALSSITTALLSPPFLQHVPETPLPVPEPELDPNDDAPIPE